MRTLIGAGEQREGVYYLKQATARQANAVNATWLWHMRLGYPSSDVLSLLPSGLGIVSESHKNKEDFFEICFHAKQTRNKFLVSQSNAKEIFDLIHCDI